ncbi:MAG TPA: glycosyltransferase [Puia sp.]|nr:glycosyltransferase [Puia sp.]
MSHQFIKNRDIILFSFQQWNSDIAFNFKDMAYELARYNRVLFIDRARDRNTVLKNIFSGKTPHDSVQGNLEQIQDNFWVLHPDSVLESGTWSPTYKLFDFFNRINNKRIALEIKNGIKKLDFKNCLLINDNDFYRGLYLKSLLPVREYIFYLRDFLTVQPFFEKFGPRCEMEMIRKADLVVANSAWLANYAGQWNPNSVDIGQGCNLKEFVAEDLPVPEDLKAVPEPIIGYCGAITSMRLDENLLLYIASSLPEMSLVLVGPADSKFEKSPLRSMKNVYFQGSKKPEKTASYVHHFSICINPQLVNSLTIGNYPRKIDEYLASGKPVVATATLAMEMFRKYVELCNTKEEFLINIHKLVNEPVWTSADQKNMRREFALTHTWENSVGAMGDAFYYLEKSYNPAVI